MEGSRRAHSTRATLSVRSIRYDDARARVSTLALLALRALLSIFALVAADAGTGAAVELADAVDEDLELDALLDEAEAEASAGARNLQVRRRGRGRGCPRDAR